MANSLVRKYLMHKNDVVAVLLLTPSNLLVRAEAVRRPELLPVGVSARPDLISETYGKWMKTRCIPDSRQGLEVLLTKTGKNIPTLLFESMAVSMDDCYWLKSEDEAFTWEDVNYYENGFSERLGKIVMDECADYVADGRGSPDITTPGVLKKAWMNLDGEPYLVKYGFEGTPEPDQVSANEVIASVVAEQLGINHIPYFPLKLGDGKMVCACPRFLKDDKLDFVAMRQIQINRIAVTGDDILKLLHELGYGEEVDRMLAFDYLIGNQDRHLENFGLLRNSETMEIEGFAPLFDSGSCFFFNMDTDRIGKENMVYAKPFRDSQEEQLELVTDLAWYNDAALDGISDYIRETYERFGISKERTEKVVEAFERNRVRVKERAKEIEKEIRKEERRREEEALLER